VDGFIDGVVFLEAVGSLVAELLDAICQLLSTGFASLRAYFDNGQDSCTRKQEERDITIQNGFDNAFLLFSSLLGSAGSISVAFHSILS
jgi:hypothetical protein